MKYILSLGFLLVILGCSTPTISPDSHNAVIPFGEEEVGIFIPPSWEKIRHPSGADGIILLARNGDENIAVSFEQSNELATGSSLCNGAAKGFSPFEQTFMDEENCFFSGHPSANTPLRHFWQKIVHMPNETNFLLASCSIEQQSPNNSSCPTILESFKILDKTE
jgi:hypothetical protein